MATLGGAAAWPLISNIAESVFGTHTGLYGECLTLMASGENWTPDRLAEGVSAIPLFAHVHLSSLLFSLTRISVYILVWLCSQGRLRPRQTGLSARTDARARGAKRQWHAKLIA